MAPTRRRASPAARGYDEAHRAQVRRLISAHIDGTPCYWCGLPMFRDRTKNPDYDPNAMRRDGKPDVTSGQLHGEHPDGKDGGKLPERLMHGLCNKQRGNGDRDDERPALRLVRTEHPLGNLTMGWPAA
ncbi:uncharacterized protein RMCC_1370 [Mycolicibacterium canariasense]|uniref:HNH endonuclease n=1 Tax=Mycolicibacterium canariasense TaxID=228230 RepID=A0A100WAB6_MYCCR|nr:hypothetical protein [Mycolicibacterium canariasense]MCV7208808.1 hypothetical protein [Mycolicibacterium canariasense]ORV07127.1 hypothetical protein AWB94_14085 [Mycolicibacterium canariasense]GAS94404.1 uncharacterized protein RMCC_1370 [Mycolicibacterium canariasense]